MGFFRLLDEKFFLYIYKLGGHYSAIDNAIVFFAEWFPYLIVLILFFVIFKYVRNSSEREILLSKILASVALAFLTVTQIFWRFYLRPRPYIQNNLKPLIMETAHSFPSGHASFFFALSFSVYFYNKKWGILFLAMSVIMCLARVAAGVHFPSDILAGFVLGFLISFAVFKFFKLFKK